MMRNLNFSGFFSSGGLSLSSENTSDIAVTVFFYLRGFIWL
jgi:hypothetical protein